MIVKTKEDIYMSKIVYPNAQEFVELINNEKQVEDKKKSGSKTPMLNQYGKNLTVLAKEGKLDPVIGREPESRRILEILCRRNKNSIRFYFVNCIFV